MVEKKTTQLDEAKKQQQREKSQISCQVFFHFLFFSFLVFMMISCVFCCSRCSLFYAPNSPRQAQREKDLDQGGMRDRGPRATNVEQQDFYGFMGTGMTSLLVHPWAGPAMLFPLPLSHSVCK